MKKGERKPPMKTLFKPRSIAVIGASNDPSRIGAMPIRFLLKHGYLGEIYPVNPKYQEVFGLPCYPTLRSTPGKVDLVLVAIQRRFVPGALQECSEKKVPYAILFTAGYGETGVEGKKEQEALLRFARQSGIRLIGPNCIGIVCPHENLTASFISGLEMPRLIPGHIGVIAQSGGVCNAILTRSSDRLMGLRALISTGNELDLEMTDFIEHFVQDPQTRAIALLMESLKDPAKFIRAADRAMHENKPLVVLKLGRSEKGRQAAASHTGAMAGAYAVYQGLFRQKGICSVSDIDELFEVAHLLSCYGARGGHRLAILSTSGGTGALMADLAADNFLHLPVPSARTRDRLHDLMPATTSMANPMDITTQFMNDADAISRYLQTFGEDENFDVLVLVLTLSTSEQTLSLARRLALIAPSLKKPLVVCWPVGMIAHRAFRHLDEAGVPLFFQPAICMSALGHFARYGKFQKARA